MPVSGTTGLQADITFSLTFFPGDVMQLINSYDAKYGPVHPVFYQGTYAQALNAAKQELTFLIVYLHSDNNRCETV